MLAPPPSAPTDADAATAIVLPSATKLSMAGYTQTSLDFFSVVPPRQLHALSALKLPILHHKVTQLWQLRRQANSHWTELAVGSNESH
jgi:hypothetical protein